MLLGSRQTLEDFLVRLLGEQQSASAAQLIEGVKARFQPYSVPAVYKELEKLRDHGVVVKRGNEFSLSVAWVLNLVELCDKMYELHVDSSVPSAVLPSGKSNSFRFSNLVRVDDFWVHATIILLQHSERKSIFQWFPHPWFNLVNSHKSLSFHNALRAGGYRAFNIIGGDNFLDRQAERTSTRGVYEYSFAPGPFQEERSHYYSVTDTYLLTVKLTEKKAAEIDRYYTSVRSALDVDISVVLELMTNAPGTVVTIETSQKKIKKAWNQFVEYFADSRERKL